MIAKSAFIAPQSSIIGDVQIGEHSSVWFQAVLRGDVCPIVIGRKSNIQDGSIVHGTFGKFSTTVGNEVTVGHAVILHGTTVEDLCLIGMGSVLMDGSRIGHHSIVGAGSLVTEGSQFEPYSLILGRPAKRVRALKPEEVQFLSQSAENYVLYSSWYTA